MALEARVMAHGLRDGHIQLSGDETVPMKRDAIVGLHPLRQMWEWAPIRSTRLPLD
jgi:hypothetical protein